VEGREGSSGADGLLPNEPRYDRRVEMYDLQLSDKALSTWALLRQTWTVMDKAAATRLSKVGLTPEKVAVLWICRDFPGIVTTAEIARILTRQSQSVTGLLNRMEEEGLITRTPKRKGRPFTEVRMTPRGEEACAVGVTVLKALIKETESTLSSRERQQLHRLLGLLRQQMVDSLHLELTVPRDLPEREHIPVRW
jgi:DNA-binding MarR family transcriptional regulator